jgi:phage shock protein A
MEEWDSGVAVSDQIDAWQDQLAGCEREVSRIRARQVELIRQLDRFQVDTADGARTMGDWSRFFTPASSS